MCVRVCECMHASHVQTQREDHTAPSGEQGTPFSPLIYFPAIKHAILYLISVNVVSFPHLSSSRSLVKCFVFVFFNDTWMKVALVETIPVWERHLEACGWVGGRGQKGKNERKTVGRIGRKGEFWCGVPGDTPRGNRCQQPWFDQGTVKVMGRLAIILNSIMKEIELETFYYFHFRRTYIFHVFSFGGCAFAPVVARRYWV